MANLKNITELPLAESTEGLNLIVNDNGAAKQIEANKVSVQADWNVTDENSPAFIKNKPVEEEYDIVFEWNGERLNEMTIDSPDFKTPTEEDIVKVFEKLENNLPIRACLKYNCIFSYSSNGSFKDSGCF